MKSDTKMGVKGRKVFTVVGIGASAGGLNALHCFVGQLPKEFGFAVVFVQHLSPKHKSLLPDLLRNRRPDIGIVEISDGMKLLPGKIYLGQAGKKTMIVKGAFHTTNPSVKQLYFPIDEFFTSLAEEAGEQAVAVIFSGAGTDGARGVEEIRNNGGAVFVQEPGTAEFPSMPLAAINTGRADGVLPPDDIAQEILKLQGTSMVSASSADLITPVQFDDLLSLIRDKTGYRFDHYKKNVLSRRIIRRMHLRGVSAVRDYINVVADKDSEASNLAADLMIGVTSFFRDRLAWKALKTEVIKKLAASDDKQPLRIWTPACSTGEEAYSIAMMLRHEFDLSGKKRGMQVFATDLNDAALEKARGGRYPADITADVPPDYMKKFFTCSDDGLSVIVGDEIRGSVVFARQDLLTDPPFSQLDLIICRNLMIYLEPVAQEKCIGLFHYALKDCGYLFLGNAETPGGKSLLFKSLTHKKCRIYQKIEAQQPATLSFAVPFASHRPSPAPSRAVAEYQHNVTELIQQALLEESGPAAVAVNQHFDIVYNNGPTNRYLRQPRGAPTQNLLELLPENLRNRIRGALYKADRDKTPVSVRLIVPKDDKKRRQVILLISKLGENLFLVIFREKRGVIEELRTVSSEIAVDENTVHQLENELSSTRAELQSNIEQLKSLNEELQSSNEELQAANEELETSREELQSLNEELITLNAQLQSKIEEEEETNNDLNNFLSSTNIPTVFLDHRFRVKRFTPAMSRLLKLIPSDVGRPIIDMSQANLGPDLIAHAQVVLDHLTPITKEIAVGDRWYIRTTLPYRTADNRIEGVVITYADISELKRSEENTARLTARLAAIVESADDAIISKDINGIITTWNIGAERIFGYTSEEAIGRHISFLIPPGHADDVSDVLAKIARGEHAERFETERMKKDGTIIPVSLTFSPIKDTTGTVLGISKIAHDISERKRAEALIAARLRILEEVGGLSLDETLRTVLDEIERQTQSTIGFYHFLEADQETLFLQNWSTNTLQKMCTAEGKGSHYPVSKAGVWVDCVRERRPVIHNNYASLPHRKGLPSGHAPVIREMVVPVMRSNSVVAIIGVGNKPNDYNDTDVEIASLLGDFSWEIVERKRAEEALRASEENYRNLFDSSADGIFIMDFDGKFIDANRTAYERLGYTREEFLSLDIRRLDHPSFATLAPERFRIIRQHGYAVFESCHLLKDGSMMPVEVNARLLEYEGRQVFFSVIRDISERKRAEEALRTTSERYRSYIDVTGQLGWTTNADGEVLEDIPSWRAYTGQTYDDTKGWGWAEALHPDDVKHTEQIWRRAVAEKRSYEVEYRIRRHDGIYRHFMARGIPVFKEDGSVREWVGTCIDISERKQAEEALLRLNRTLKALNDSSQAVIRAKDEPEYLNDVCRIIIEDCGYKMAWIGFAEHDEAQSVRPIAHSGFDEGYLERLKITWADTELGRGPTGTAIRTGKMAMCRNMLTDPAFAPWREEAIRRGYASSIVFPLIADDEVIGAITIYSDQADPFSEGDVRSLTELADNLSYGIKVLRIREAREKAEESLKRSLARFELLTVTAGELLQSTEPQKVVESVCRKVMDYLDCHAFFNFFADEKSGKLHLNAYAGISAEEARRIEWLDFGVSVCGCAARDGCRIVVEKIPTTPDERTELIKSYGINAYCCHPLLGPGGKVIGTLSFGTCSHETFGEEDLSLMKAVSDQVAAAAVRMRNEANVMKLNEDMAVRNVELEMVNKELEAFIYSISHDLRAPIRTVAGFARFLDQDYKDKLDTQARDYIRRICAASGKITLLIDDLLRLAKISRQEVARTKIDLTTLAESVIADLREAYPGRSIEVVIAEGLTVFADRGLMELVLSNLLGNAWKFTSKTESARIEVGATEKDGKAVCYVRDNGAGFDPKYMEKMFWPFQRLHSESEFEGTGIGLTIVERIVHRHGGRVWAEGEVGKGATIYFTMG